MMLCGDMLLRLKQYRNVARLRLTLKLTGRFSKI